MEPEALTFQPRPALFSQVYLCFPIHRYKG
jgi:hypothetical protein